MVVRAVLHVLHLGECEEGGDDCEEEGHAGRDEGLLHLKKTRERERETCKRNGKTWTWTKRSNNVRNEQSNIRRIALHRQAGRQQAGVLSVRSVVRQSYRITFISRILIIWYINRFLVSGHTFHSPRRGIFLAKRQTRPNPSTTKHSMYISMCSHMHDIAN